MLSHGIELERLGSLPEGPGGQHLKLVTSERTEHTFFWSGRSGGVERVDQELDLIIRENAEIVIWGNRRTLPGFGHRAAMERGG